jgi:hypothetical protein
VIAVEVHQNGTSSDVTFGAEFFSEVESSIVFSGEVPLRISTQDGNIVISWTGNGLMLEATESLGPTAQWQPVDKQINPYFTSRAASAQKFYRLR